MSLAPRLRPLVLPRLTSHDGSRLADDDDHERVTFGELDLDGQHAVRTRFTECAFDGTALGELQLRDSRLHDVSITRCSSSSLDVAGSAWRDVTLERCRLGALVAYDVSMGRVMMRASKVSFVNLRAARMNDVLLDDVDVGELDLSSAVLERVALVGCRVERLVLDAATLSDVDLSRSSIGEVVGIGQLRGATLSWSQIVELAPTMAAHLGVEVAQD